MRRAGLQIRTATLLGFAAPALNVSAAETTNSQVTQTTQTTSNTNNSFSYSDFISEPVNQEKLSVIETSLEYTKQITDKDVIDSFSSETASLLNAGTINLSNNATRLNYDKTLVAKYSDDTTSYTIVVLPVIGGNLSLLSTMSLMFSDDGTLLSYYQTDLSESSTGYFHITDYVNGKILQQRSTEIPWTDNSEIETLIDQESAENNTVTQLPEGRTTKSSWKACLVKLGVNATVAGVVVTVCWVACLSSESNLVSAAGCGVCITGVLGWAALSNKQIDSCL